MTPNQNTRTVICCCFFPHSTNFFALKGYMILASFFSINCKRFRIKITALFYLKPLHVRLCVLVRNK